MHACVVCKYLCLCVCVWRLHSFSLTINTCCLIEFACCAAFLASTWVVCRQLLPQFRPSNGQIRYIQTHIQIKSLEDFPLNTCLSVWVCLRKSLRLQWPNQMRFGKVRNRMQTENSQLFLCICCNFTQALACDRVFCIHTLFMLKSNIFAADSNMLVCQIWMSTQISSHMQCTVQSHTLAHVLLSVLWALECCILSCVCCAAGTPWRMSYWFRLLTALWKLIAYEWMNTVLNAYVLFLP